MSSSPTDGNLRAVKALLRLRDLEDRDAKVKLQKKQMEIHRVAREIASIKKRRENVIRRGGAHVLRERLLLDALMELLRRRSEVLGRLKVQAGLLLEKYQEAKGRKDALANLHARKREEREYHMMRRADELAGDTTSVRKASEPKWEETCDA